MLLKRARNIFDTITAINAISIVISLRTDIAFMRVYVYSTAASATRANFYTTLYKRVKLFCRIGLCYRIQPKHVESVYQYNNEYDHLNDLIDFHELRAWFDFLSSWCVHVAAALYIPVYMLNIYSSPQR